jgi:hypothetical protein
MSQVLLEINNQSDLMLLISFAKRLNISVKSVHTDNTLSKKELMRQAANDPIFLTDIQEIENDFAFSDSELNF